MDEVLNVKWCKCCEFAFPNEAEFKDGLCEECQLKKEKENG